jgi:Mycothiol maleylpyruvate isomerase N-terminal domain
MVDRSFADENNAARVELSELIAGLDERSFKCPVGSGWTISTCLCHLAFWDHRVLFLLDEWARTGQLETSRLSSQSVNSINQAVNAISQAVPGAAAAKQALDAALAVDSLLAAISDESISQLVSAGFERYLKRSLHRREHLQKIKEALHG